VQKRLKKRPNESQTFGVRWWPPKDSRKSSKPGQSRLQHPRSSQS